MITSFLFFLAAFFKAVSDTLLHHFSISIFKNRNPNFWNPKISINKVPLFEFTIPLINKTIKTKYRPDAWHLSNSGMICSFCLAASIISTNFLIRPNFVWFVEFIVNGVLFILTFNLFYNKVLLDKKIW